MKVGIIGCGVMGSALAQTIVKNHEVTLYDHKKENAEPLGKKVGAPVATSLEKLAKGVEVVILAVKPKDVEKVADDLDPLLQNDTLLLSILSGTPLQRLKELFSNPKIFRLMPNLPILCGKGMIGVVEEEEHLEEDKIKVEKTLKGLGTITWFKEPLMNAFIALTGSNPAYIYLIIEAMVEAGISMGFKAAQAQEFILETFEGAVALLRHSKSLPEELRWRISSPGGTTIAGLNELEAHNVRYGIIRGIQRTQEKAQEMES
ncbi:MAG: pyrroline-5-carboxylate reductase [Simkaniaceae bacterium]